MSGIKGKVKEQVEYSKKVGLFEAEVVAVCPTKKELEKLGRDVENEPDYVGESNEGNIQVRIDVFLKEVNEGDIFKTSFFLEDKERTNQDETKLQYINSIGIGSWAEDEDTLPAWFSNRDYRVAHVGEEQFYGFLRVWLSKLDYRDEDTVLELNWRKLMNGNFSEIKEQINGEYASTIGALATIKTTEKDGEPVEYQNIYNKSFLYPFSLKQFRLRDYDSIEVNAELTSKTKLKPHERFVKEVYGEYGCKDFFILKDLQDYDETANVAASDNFLVEENDDDSDIY